jgi:sucrose-6-phosphate hydrolase SacC (GH32 family)
VFYAAQSFAEMPDGRRVQMAWGRISPEGMPFNQLMLFPTELKLITTRLGLRLQSAPIAEIERLHLKTQKRTSLTLAEANQALDKAGSGPLHVKLTMTLENPDDLAIRYQGRLLTTMHSGPLEHGKGSLEILIDKGVAEIFLSAGEGNDVMAELPASHDGHGLELGTTSGSMAIDLLEISQMKSMWTGQDGRVR